MLYWSVGTVNIKQRNVQFVLPPNVAGVDVGNPIFAANTENVVVFDVVDRRNPEPAPEIKTPA